MSGQRGPAVWSPLFGQGSDLIYQCLLIIIPQNAIQQAATCSLWQLGLFSDKHFGSQTVFVALGYNSSWLFYGLLVCFCLFLTEPEVHTITKSAIH